MVVDKYKEKVDFSIKVLGHYVPMSFLWLPYQLPQSWWLKTREIYSLTEVVAEPHSL